MAKFCSNCGKELDDNTVLCLNCGVLVGNNNSSTTNNNKKKGLPTWAIVLIVIGCFTLLPIIFITIIAITTFNTISDTDFNIKEIIEGIGTQSGTIGDTLLTENFKIKLTDAKTYDVVGEGELIEESKEGKEYLVFFLDIENISNETNSIYSYDFNGYIENYSTTEKNIEVDIEGIENLKANLLPGTKAKGYIAYEVDKNWTEFELYYEDWYGNKIIYTIVNEDNSNITGV